jgi:hypothetical protein
MITNFSYEIKENDICLSKPTIFCISNNENTEKIYVLQSGSFYNPCDYVENLFCFIQNKDLKIDKLFIDLRNYYGEYTESWLWECIFVKDNHDCLEDVIFRDIKTTKLSEVENKFLKEYLYNSSNHEISVCR